MTLLALDIADDSGAWRALGFAAEGTTVRIGTTDLVLKGSDLTGPASTGILGWTIGADSDVVPDLIDGITTRVDNGDRSDGHGVGGGSANAPSHTNGVSTIDHVVAMTPDLDRTIDAFTECGFELRRVRDAGGGRHQAFFWVGNVVLEVVGDPKAPSGPARLWGLAFVTDDIDATAAFLGPDRCTKPGAAVQKGRRICSLTPAAGLSVPVAFMTPHDRQGETSPATLRSPV